MNNIILCGFMGSGKTTVGKRLATLTGRVFVDMDAEIEQRAGKSISEIFARDGEPAAASDDYLVIAAAARLGSTRLIDNVSFSLGKS